MTPLTPISFPFFFPFSFYVTFLDTARERFANAKFCYLDPRNRLLKAERFYLLRLILNYYISCKTIESLDVDLHFKLMVIKLANPVWVSNSPIVNLE